jgi:hypothetical protein
MNGRIPALRLLAALFAVLAVSAVSAGAAGAEVVYNNIPAKLPGNFASIGLAATSSTEFGGEIQLAGTARKQPSVTVVMSSWACQSGGVYEETCATTKPKQGFKIPLTVKVYAAAELGEGPVAEVTKTEKMLYRPSVSSKCTTGAWYDEAEAACYHGFAFPLTIKLPKLKKMPGKAIVTFSFPHSSGPAQSLNVAVSEPPENTLSIGSQPVEEWFVNSTWSGMYCTGTPGAFGPEGGNCSSEAEGTNYQPVISVSAS